MITAAGKELTAEQMQHIFASRFPGGILNYGYHESSPYRKTETEAQKFYGGNNILTYGPDSAGLYGKTKRITLAPIKGVGMFTFQGILPDGEGSLYLRMYSPIFGMRKDLLGEIKLTCAGETGWLGDVQVKKDRTFEFAFIIFYLPKDYRSSYRPIKYSCFAESCCCWRVLSVVPAF